MAQGGAERRPPIDSEAERSTLGPLIVCLENGGGVRQHVQRSTSVGQTLRSHLERATHQGLLVYVCVVMCTGCCPQDSPNTEQETGLSETPPQENSRHTLPVRQGGPITSGNRAQAGCRAGNPKRLGWAFRNPKPWMGSPATRPKPLPTSEQLYEGTSETSHEATSHGASENAANGGG